MKFTFNNLIHLSDEYSWRYWGIIEIYSLSKCYLDQVLLFYICRMKSLKKNLKYLNFKYKMPYNTNALKKMRVKICLYLLTNTRLYTSRMLRAPTEMTSYFVSKWNRWIWFRYTYIEIYTYKNKSNFQYFWGMNNIINKLHIHYVMKIIKLMKVSDNSSKNIQFIDNFWNQVKAYNFQLNM